MLKGTIHIACLLSCFALSGQDREKDSVPCSSKYERYVLTDPINADTLLLLMAYDPTLDSVKFKSAGNALNKHIEFLEGRRERYSKEASYLKFVFRQTHKKYLHTYVTYGDFNKLFDSGDYNCVSGTALYVYVLGKLGFQVSIVETRYHSFLTINRHSNDDYLIEATDPAAGLIYGSTNVARKMKEYERKEELVSANGVALSPKRYPAMSRIRLADLAGLHYFNLAVVCFNSARFDEAANYLSKAEVLYPESERVKDLLSLTKLCIDAHGSTTKDNSDKINQVLTRKRK